MSELLRVAGMSVGFRGPQGACLAVTDDVSFSIAPGEVFALVGESGCGKSVTAMGILRLLPVPSAQVLQGYAWFAGEDLLHCSWKRLVQLRGSSIGVIFQEPTAALNPVQSIGSQLRECLRDYSASERQTRIHDLMKRAGFSDVERVLRAFPHEMSGGMLQRVVIVMALLRGPQLLIADEPTTALDVTVQAQVMEILHGLCREQGTGLLLITHNLGLVAQYADRVGVMYAGRMVEEATVADLLQNPAHPYTQGLLRAVPEGHDSVNSLVSIPGQVPRPQNFVPGCRFANRCVHADAECEAKPALRKIGNTHWVCCVHSQESRE